MDWIDEILYKLKIKIDNLSLKKALIVYILVCVVIIGLMTAVTQKICSKWDDMVSSKYEDAYMTDIYNSGTHLIIYDYSKCDKRDRMLTEIIDFIQTWSTVVYSLAGIIGVSYLFYNNKLKKPIKLLTEAADMVGNNNLDMEISYDKKDEMGRLCAAFDAMRRQLIANNQKMWDMMEEQKRINAAFAHDLRTPLTVLRGYVDLLSKYLPEGKISEEKLLSTLKLMSDHISRLENYSNTMKQLNSLEELSVNRRHVECSSIVEKLKGTTQILMGRMGIDIKLITASLEDGTSMLLDEAIFMEVFDNLLSNALRYAKSRIEIILSLSEDEEKLILSVADDGRGFSQTDLKMATKAYYTDGKGKASNHFGIGLYICKLLCEKHGGYITLENGINTGAIVIAAFSIR